jgi:hypothetical protein
MQVKQREKEGAKEGGREGRTQHTYLLVELRSVQAAADGRFPRWGDGA